MDKVIVTKEELDKIKQIQADLDKVTAELGVLEIQTYEINQLKQQVYREFERIKEVQNKVGKEMSEKYGNGNLDLATGEFIKNS